MQRDAMLAYLALGTALVALPASVAKSASAAAPAAATAAVLPATLTVDRIDDGDARISVVVTNAGVRPHSSLSYLTPVEFNGTKVASTTEGRSAASPPRADHEDGKPDEPIALTGVVFPVTIRPKKAGRSSQLGVFKLACQEPQPL